MIPGLPQDMLQGSDEEGSLRMKRMIYITDSMTAKELDSDGSPFMEMVDGKPVGLTWRVTRIAKGSGTSVREVEELLCQYRMMANMAKQAGGKNGWFVIFQKPALTVVLIVSFQVICDPEDAGCWRKGPWCKRYANTCTNTSYAGMSMLQAPFFLLSKYG